MSLSTGDNLTSLETINALTLHAFVYMLTGDYLDVFFVALTPHSCYWPVNLNRFLKLDSLRLKGRPTQLQYCSEN